MFNEKGMKNVAKMLVVFLVIVSAYFLVKFASEIKTFSGVGERSENTISVSGHGEVFASADIASVYLTVESSKETQSASSDEVNKKTKQIFDFLKTSGIDEKDIKTEGYGSYPKYSNSMIPCTLEYGIANMPCRGESKIVGYTVSQSMSVKIRKVDDTSKIIDGINKIGVTNMSGPDFSIDDQDGLKADARALAIDDARLKAKRLAKDLGVRIVKVSSFSESGNYPIMYAKTMSVSADSAGTSTPSVLPQGQNKITSDVTIVYEIK